MKLFVTGLSIALISSTAVAADVRPPSSQPDASTAAEQSVSPERLALARQFVDLTQPADKIVEMFRVGFWQGAAKSIETGADFPQVEAQLDRILARLEPAVLDNMSPLIEAYAHVYAREFSDAELEQMIAFAQSAAGKHYLQDFPRLESDPMITDAAMELIDELSPLLEDVQKELCADAAAQRIAAGDTDARCPLSAPDIAAG